jgi:hypothetical protein
VSINPIVTADGVEVSEGDQAFNYYDHKPGRIGRIDERPQPDTLKGQDSSTPMEEWSNHWFTFLHDDGSRTSLDGSRICSVQHAQAKGWI